MLSPPPLQVSASGSPSWTIGICVPWGLVKCARDGSLSRPTESDARVVGARQSVFSCSPGSDVQEPLIRSHRDQCLFSVFSLLSFPAPGGTQESPVPFCVFSDRWARPFKTTNASFLGHGATVGGLASLHLLTFSLSLSFLLWGRMSHFTV